MKKITLLLLIFVLTFTFSCSSDDDTPNTTYKLVKIESFNPNNELNYTTTVEYNEDGFISKTIEISSYGTNITNYIYSNGKIITIDYVGNNESENYTYTGDLITSSVYDEAGQISNNTYTYNSNNQVIKKFKTIQGSTTEYETTYMYDNNGNVITKTFDFSIYNYTYDSKKNPLKLAFTEALLKITGVGENNPLSNGSADTYTYEYNDNNYPSRQNDFYNGVLEAYSLYSYEEI